MAIAETEVLIARNPATGAELGRVPATPAEQVAESVARARQAQKSWGETSWPERRDLLERWSRVLARQADTWTRLITAEVGKPAGEASAEVIATLDALRWTVQYGRRALASHRISPRWQRWLLLPPARLKWQPIGVIGMLGTWNYPLFLNAPTIAQALAAGNAVVWKPSELASWIGVRIQRSLEEAGLPAGLVAAVYGGPGAGQALAQAEIDKGVFTGGVANGRHVLGVLGDRGIPAIAELSGFDPAIVLPDAPFESTVRALTWAAFVGSGQACIAVKRIYVVGNANPWAEALAARAQALRLGDPGREAVDLGPLISAAARERFDHAIQAALAAGPRLLTGGAPRAGPGWFYPPTVLLADSPGAEAALAGCFGPVVVVRGVRDTDEAVAAANAGRFGLSAGVWGRDRRAAEQVAARLQAGVVGVNDAVTFGGHAGAPFGGVKASGYGRVHGALGLREFTQPQVLFTRSAGGLRPQLFPYSPRFESLLAAYRWVFYRRS